jgi:hypothetical protein
VAGVEADENTDVKTLDEEAEEKASNLADEDYARPFKGKNLGDEAGETAGNLSEAGLAPETGASPELEDGEDDEEPLLLTEIVNETSSLYPAARGKDSAKPRSEDKGAARAANFSGLTEEAASDGEDEAAILDLKDPAEEEMEAPPPDKALGLRRPGQGKKNLEHRLATLDHWSRREPAKNKP